VLLLDEPLNAVDEETRDRLIELLHAVRTEGNLTVLHVTHSRLEADRLGDHLFRLAGGRVERAE
jgi:ABC-type sulfate/molybdate transport systems ATPase subunit